MKSYEMELSKQIVMLLRLKGFFFFHPASEGKRTIWEQIQFKANGGIAGVSDLVIVMNNEIIFVELKRPGGIHSKSQKEFEREVESRGHKYYIWNKIDDAIDFVNKNKP